MGSSDTNTRASRLMKVMDGMLQSTHGLLSLAMENEGCDQAIYEKEHPQGDLNLGHLCKNTSH